MKRLIGLSQIFTLLLLVFFALITTGCGSGGAGGGTGGGGTPGIPGPGPIPGTTPTPTPVVFAGNIPTPQGFSSKSVGFSNGVLEATVDQFGRAIQEAYLVLVYHSASPSSSGNPVSFSGEIDSYMRSTGNAPAADKIRLSEKEMPAVPHNNFNFNHLEILKKNFDFMKRMIQQGRYPQEPGKDELIAKGKLDSSGIATKDSYGDGKSFWIYFPQPYYWQNRPCTCRAVGTHCYVYADNDDGIYYNNMDNYAQQIADYFDNTIYPIVHTYIGTEWDPGIDGDSRIYIVLSANIQNAYCSFSDEYPSAQVPQDDKSNECEALYVDPILFSQIADTKIDVMQAVVGHEYAHLVRFAMKFIYSNNGTPVSYSTVDSQLDQEMSLQEGNSIFTENILLDRGITSNYPDISPMRSQPLESYLRIPELCSLTSYDFNNNNNSGIGIYEMGFLIVDYIYEKLGFDAIKKFNQADGKVGLASLYASTGNTSFDDIFDMQAISMALSGRVADSNYTFNSIDLSGSINYGGYYLHNSWNLKTNCGSYLDGIDLNQLESNGYDFTFPLYEWAPVIIRVFNGNGFKIKITQGGSLNGGGQIKTYFFYR